VEDSIASIFRVALKMEKQSTVLKLFVLTYLTALCRKATVRTSSNVLRLP
jgi:hypothetical protein